MIDGVNLHPYATGKEAGRAHQTLLWRSGQYESAIDGDWKLQSCKACKKAWLYDLSNDPTERQSPADTQPQKVKALLALLAGQDATTACRCSRSTANRFSVRIGLTSSSGAWVSRALRRVRCGRSLRPPYVSDRISSGGRPAASRRSATAPRAPPGDVQLQHALPGPSRPLRTPHGTDIPPGRSDATEPRPRR